MKYIIKTITVIFILLLLASSISCGFNYNYTKPTISPEKTQDNKEETEMSQNYWNNENTYGIQSVNGKLKLNGDDFYGMGVNFYNLFNNGLKNDYSVFYSFKGLEILSKNQIPFVRFNAGVYYYNELYLYKDNKIKYLKTLKDIADEAEKLKIGLIPSFFWLTHCVPDYVDEPIRKWGDKNSKTRAFMREYTTDIVNTLKDSKAVWGWEFGNEFNLAVDLPNAAQLIPNLPADSSRIARTTEDYLKSSDVNDAFKEFADIVRQIDTPKRFISSGNADLRASQYNQHTSFGTSWQQDTEDEHKQINLFLNPDDMDVISEHLYFTKHSYFSIDNYTLKEHIEMSMRHADEAKKPFIIGEFGHNNNTEPLPTEEERLEAAKQMAMLFVENNVQMSLLWNYSPANTIVEYSFNETTSRGHFLLNVVKDANQAYNLK